MATTPIRSVLAGIGLIVANANHFESMVLLPFNLYQIYNMITISLSSLQRPTVGNYFSKISSSIFKTQIILLGLK
jgi:hypothetical protein